MDLLYGIIGFGAGVILDRVVIPSAFDAPVWVETDSTKADTLSRILQREGVDHRMTNEAGPGQVFVVMAKASDRARARVAIATALRPRGAPVPIGPDIV
jgi:hypothetical protein